MYDMSKDIERVLITEEQLKEGIARVARQIEKDYEGKELVCVCILKGGVLFMADLIREIKMPLQIDFMAVSSYGRSVKTSGVVTILKDLSCDITGKHVIIVEDIVDSGLTLSYLKDYLSHRGAASLKIATLLDKPEGRKVQLDADYAAFPVPNAFVVGYGLDYAEKYRNLPYIGELKKEVYAPAAKED